MAVNAPLLDQPSTASKPQALAGNGLLLGLLSLCAKTTFRHSLWLGLLKLRTSSVNNPNERCHWRIEMKSKCERLQARRQGHALSFGLLEDSTAFSAFRSKPLSWSYITPCTTDADNTPLRGRSSSAWFRRLLRHCRSSISSSFSFSTARNTKSSKGTSEILNLPES